MIPTPQADEKQRVLEDMRGIDRAIIKPGHFGVNFNAALLALVRAVGFTNVDLSTIKVKYKQVG